MDSCDNHKQVETIDVLGQFFVSDGWHPQQLDDTNCYRMVYGGQNGNFVCFSCIIENSMLLFYAAAPIKVPEKRRIQATEFIARANFGLRIGNFEMNFTDRQIRYRSNLSFQGAELRPALIKECIYPAVLTLDRYLPSLMSLIDGEKSVQEALFLVKG